MGGDAGFFGWVPVVRHRTGLAIYSPATAGLGDHQGRTIRPWFNSRSRSLTPLAASVGELSPGPGHGRHERGIGRDDARVRHVQRVWRRRPRFDADAGVFHVIDDPIFAVGADGEFEFARPAHDRVGAQVAESSNPKASAPARSIRRSAGPSSRWPTSAPAQRRVQARRSSAFRRGGGQTRDASRPPPAWARAHAARCGTSPDPR